jgi:hypothetical protein
MCSRLEAEEHAMPKRIDRYFLVLATIATFSLAALLVPLAMALL